MYLSKQGASWYASTQLINVLILPVRLRIVAHGILSIMLDEERFALARVFQRLRNSAYTSRIHTVSLPRSDRRRALSLSVEANLASCFLLL